MPKGGGQAMIADLIAKISNNEVLYDSEKQELQMWFSKLQNAPALLDGFYKTALKQN